MLKTVLVTITQLLLVSPIILTLLRTFMLLRAGNPYMFWPLFSGFIANLVLLAIFLVSIIFIVYKNKDLTKKAIILHLILGIICIILHYSVGFAISEVYKNTNIFD